MKNEKEAIILILVRVEGNVSKGAQEIRSKSASQSYRDNWDAIFASKPASQTLN